MNTGESVDRCVACTAGTQRQLCMCTCRFGAGGPCATPLWHDALASEMGAANIAEFMQSEVATVSASKDALGIIKKVRGG